jgi:hypothetical protein
MDSAALLKFLHEELALFRDAQPRPLADLVDVAIARSGFGKDGTPFAAMGQPILLLPAWIANRSGRHPSAISDGDLFRCSSASMFGYLRVRLQDDWFDEGAGQPESLLLLNDALTEAHLRTLFDAVGSHPEFWKRFGALWSTYRDAMLLEARLRRGEIRYDAQSFASALGRTVPLAIPGLAVLAVARRWDDALAIERLVGQLASATQWVNDLLDAEKDLDQGNRSWVLQDYGEEGVAGLRLRLSLGGGFGATLQKARDSLSRAREIARHLQLGTAEAWFDDRELTYARMEMAFSSR